MSPGANAATAGSTAGGDTGRSVASMETLVGRLVIEQGLATQDEVQHCAELAAESGDKSFLQLLVDHEFVTTRQIERLRQTVEAERAGQKIPGYRILGKLGAGAMATVYKAKQLNLDRLVAIKVLPRKFSSNSQFIERFYAEGRAAAQLNHPNIVQAYDVGRAGEYHYFIMEFVDGQTVFDDIVKNRRYGEKEAVEIVIQVATALQHAHERGIIHRDVKPKNIMLTKSGVAKLADMGLARAVSDKEAAEAEAGKAFGTPYYISPEQIRGDVNIGPAADIYSLGATLYHMVTGRVPFDGENPSSVMHKHLRQALEAPDHVNPKLSAGISEVIEMMLAKDPRKRYQNCKDLLIDLREVQAGKPPILAHRGVDLGNLASLAQVEASAPAEVPVDQTARGDLARQNLTVALAVVGLVAAASIILNLVLLLS